MTAYCPSMSLTVTESLLFCFCVMRSANIEWVVGVWKATHAVLVTPYGYGTCIPFSNALTRCCSFLDIVIDQLTRSILHSAFLMMTFWMEAVEWHGISFCNTEWSVGMLGSRRWGQSVAQVVFSPSLLQGARIHTVDICTNSESNCVLIFLTGIMTIK